MLRNEDNFIVVDGISVAQKKSLILTANKYLAESGSRPQFNSKHMEGYEKKTWDRIRELVEAYELKQEVEKFV